ncbi:hypothetical protein [Bdellovibrio sp. HCB2-146]|uniref:hypothetical protein n=1 Tax=Bdellovibrio sp. HCB2-146 TaxID=3394362 RepID=UPI0039BC25E0
MRAIFPQAKLIFGFDSTGPKGVTAGPLLKKAFLNSTPKERSEFGASSQALASAFKGRNARITQGDSEAQDFRRLRCALNEKVPSSEVLAKAFSPQEIRKNYDAALEMPNASALGRFLSENPKSLGEFYRVSRAILSQSSHMLGLQKRIYDLLLKTNIIPPDIHRKSSQDSFENFLAGGLDYIRTEQLCFMAETTPQVNLDPQWGLGPANLNTFNGVLASCFERKSFKQNLSRPISTITSCLLASKYTGDDWGCLTALNEQLTIEACLVAAQRNADVENSDDMRWYCWDRLREQGRINQAQCLVLSKSMNILGNRIKSNWNCLNDL